jgi:predicted permease
MDAELGRELAFHFDQLVLENVAEGMSHEQARDAAARTLGKKDFLAEQCRDQRRVTWLHNLKDDAMYAFRTMRKNPGFAAIVIGSLALAMGANTAILGALDAMLFGELPVPDSDKVVIIRSFRFDAPSQQSNVSLPDFLEIQGYSRSFENLGSVLADQKTLGPSAPGEPAEKIYGQWTSPGLLEALAVPPMLGRAFADSDFRAGPPASVILSHRLWSRRFGADPNIVGTKILLNEVPTEVIGVMPPDFRFLEERQEYWLPTLPGRTSLQAGVRYRIAAARLRPGVTTRQAQSELDSIAEHLAREFPDNHSGWGLRLQPYRDAIFGWIKMPLLTLEAAVVLVLLIACANIASLLLARGESRKPELAMRVALGAGAGRILRQLLTESLLLSLIGGAVGLAVAWIGLRAFATITPPPGAPRLIEIPLNVRMLLLTGLTSVAAALGFGAGPALSAIREDLAAILNQSSRTSGPSRTQQHFRSTLVSGQIALAFVLLIGSGLLMKSYARLAGRDLNLDARGLLTFEFRLPVDHFLRESGEYQGVPYMAIDPSARTKLQRIFARLQDVPGVESMAGISNPPVNSLIVPNIAITKEGTSSAVGDTSFFLVTPNLFTTLKTPFVRGRDFDDRDTAGSQWVAVINESAARRFWPGQNAVGKRFTLDSGPDERPRGVIGIVRDIPTRSRLVVAEPIVYVSYLQQPSHYRLPWATLMGQMTFIVRTPHNPMLLVPAMTNAVKEIDPVVPISSIAPMESFLQARMRDAFFYALILSVFAAVAAGLAAMGVYGSLAYAVEQRIHEIGIRVSLGANRLAVALLIGRWTVLVLGIGLAAGSGGALVLGRLVRSQLWQVAPNDPVAFAAAIVLLTSAAACACFVPLRRALAVDPAAALRSE